MRPVHWSLSAFLYPYLSGTMGTSACKVTVELRLESRKLEFRKQLCSPSTVADWIPRVRESAVSLVTISYSKCHKY
jgi:hypothetical protein